MGLAPEPAEAFGERPEGVGADVIGPATRAAEAGLRDGRGGEPLARERDPEGYLVYGGALVAGDEQDAGEGAFAGRKETASTVRPLEV